MVKRFHEFAILWPDGVVVRDNDTTDPSTLAAPLSDRPSMTGTTNFAGMERPFTLTFVPPGWQSPEMIKAIDREISRLSGSPKFAVVLLDPTKLLTD